MPLEDVTNVVAAMVRPGPAEPEKGTGPICRNGPAGAATNRTCPLFRHGVLTLSRELGAGDSNFRAALADRLKLHVYDRELLEQEAVRLGVPEAELEKIDEQPASIFQRFRPGSIYQRYFEALEQTMRELADRGDVILVGRGGNCFLRADPCAFHVRLVSPMAMRCRRVMEYRWVREAVAKKQIAESDSQRRRYSRELFRHRLVESLGVPHHSE